MLRKTIRLFSVAARARIPHQSLPQCIHSASVMLGSSARALCAVASDPTARNAVSSPPVLPCGTLRASDVGKRVKIRGWLQAVRDFGGLTFLLVRDSSGVVQLTHTGPLPWRVESVVEAVGVVRSRPDGMVNAGQSTGGVEVVVETATLLNSCGALPFQPQSGPSEEVRLTHRHIDLRRSALQRNLRLRSNVALAVRNFLAGASFIDIETPTLFRSTPEGAREFIVPTRTPGKFYSLVQSPQQYKQLLMVGGLERYYQFARCYRDEDGRADRQPEFTQIDIEMSFVESKDVMAVAEGVFLSAVAAAKQSLEQLRHLDPVTVPLPSMSSPFPSLSFTTALTRYGSDKPDRRYGLPIIDVTPVFGSEPIGFAPLDTLLDQARTVSGSASIRGVRVPQLGSRLSRKELGDFVDSITPKLHASARQVTPCRVESDGTIKSPLSKYLSDAVQRGIVKELGAVDGDLILLCAGPGLAPCSSLGAVRPLARDVCDSKQIRLSPEPSLASLWRVPPDTPWQTLCDVFWVVDFPLFERSDSGTGFQSCHHPFTAPLPGELPALRAVIDSPPLDAERLLAVKAQHYDLVFNGVEVAGGSIRIHDGVLQRDVMKHVLALPPAVVDSFGHLLRALCDGAPPHGGIAFGFDRLCAMLAGAASIRDVIAFPKSAVGGDLMTSSPASVPPETLAAYHIKVME